MSKCGNRSETTPRHAGSRVRLRAHAFKGGVSVPSGPVDAPDAAARSRAGAIRAFVRATAAAAALSGVLLAVLLALAPSLASAHWVGGRINPVDNSTQSSVTEGGSFTIRFCRYDPNESITKHFHPIGATHHLSPAYGAAAFTWKTGAPNADTAKEHPHKVVSHSATQADMHPNYRKGVAPINESWTGKGVTDCVVDRIYTADDNIVEPTEKIAVFLTKFEHYQHHPDGLGGPRSWLVDIHDNDGVLSVTDATPDDADEGDDLRFTISMDNSVVPGGHTVTPTITNGTAESSDYSVQLAPIEFSGVAGESHELVVSTVDDAYVEFDETFELTVTSSNPHLRVGTATATGTIADNDAVSLSIQSVTGQEGRRVTYSVSQADVYVEDPFIVRVRQASDSNPQAKHARSSLNASSWELVDFVHQESHLRFGGSAKGSRPGSVYLNANIDEWTVSDCTTNCTERDDETFALTGEATDKGTRDIRVSSGLVTIENSSDTKMRLLPEGGPKNEGRSGGYLVIPVYKGAFTWDDDKGNVTFKVKITGGTADSGDWTTHDHDGDTSTPAVLFSCWDRYPSTAVDPNFDASTDANVVTTRISGQDPVDGHHCALETNKVHDTVYVQMRYTGDDVREPDETIEFGFEAATYHGLSTHTVDDSATATFTLLNDDRERVYFTVEDSTGSDEYPTVIWEADPATGKPGWIKIRAHTAERRDARTPVPAAADTYVTLYVEPNECDPPSRPSFTCASAEDLVLSGTKLFIPKGQTRSTGTITITAVDNDADEGAVSSNLNCPRCKVFKLAMGASSSAGVYASGGLNMEVADDDEGGISVSPLTLTKAGSIVYLIPEGGDATRFDVTLRTKPRENVTVTPTLIAGGDTDFIVSNAAGDTGTNATLLFTPKTWNLPQPLLIKAAADADAIGGEAYFNLIPSSTDAAYNVSVRRPNGIAVAELETSAGVVLTGDSGWEHTLSVEEGDSTGASYTVKLASDPGITPATVRVALDPADDADASLTLESGKCDASGDDRKVLSRDLTFHGTGRTNTHDRVNATAWNTAQTVSVYGCEDDGIGSATVTLTHTMVAIDTVGDAKVDPNHLFLALTPSDGLSQIPDVTVSVVDNDATLVSLALRDGPDATDSVVSSISEADGVAYVSASLPSALASPVTVRVRVSTQPGGSTMAHSVSGSTLRIAAGATASTGTVRITPRDDKIDTGDKVLLITGSPSSSAAVTGPTAALLTLSNDDTAAVVSAASGLDPVNEGASATYTVKLSSQPGSDVIVSPVVPTANASDVSVSPASVTFTASNYETPQTFTVTALMDDDTADVAQFAISHEVTATVQTGNDGYESLKDSEQRPVNRGPVNVSVTDVSAAVAISARSLSVDEAATGSFPSYSVVLAAAPAAGETVTVTASWASTPTRDTDLRFVASGACPSDSGAATKTLTFTDTNWFQAQDVAVCAADDTDTTAGIAQIVHAADGSATNSKYDSLTVEAVSLAEFDDDVAALKLTSATQQQTLAGFGEIHVTESTAGTTGYQTVGVSLAKAPADDVSVTVSLEGAGFSLADSSGNPPAGDGDTLTLTFTSTTYATAQSFRVVSADDDDAAVNVGTVTLTSTATDGEYLNVTRSFRVIQVDDDDAGIEVSTRKLAVREGGYASYSLRLRSKPSANVKVYIQRSEGDASIYSSTGVVTFTPADWDRWQKAYVRANSDSDRDNGTAVLSHLVTSDGDDHYHGIPTGDADIAVVEGDTGLAQILLSTETLSVPEGGSAIYTAELTRWPSSPVHVQVHPSTTGDTDLTADTDADTAGNQSLLTFTSSNWSKAQTVTISAAADGDALAGVRRFAHTAGSSDTKYAAASHELVTATETEPTTTHSVLLSPSSLRLSSTQGDYLTVWLASAPAANKPVTVYLAPLGNATVTVHPQRLTFTSDNWNQPQVVSLRLADSGGGAGANAQVRGGGAAAAGAQAANASTQTTMVQLGVNVTSTDANYSSIDADAIPLSSAAQPISEPDVQPGADPTAESGGGAPQASAGVGSARVGGRDRYETAASLGAAFVKRLAEGRGIGSGNSDTFGPAVKVDSVIVTSGDDFPDALAASVLSRAVQAPILLTSGDGLSRGVSDFITSHGITHVHIVGGTAAVSSDVETALATVAGVAVVERYAGADRYQTAVAAATAAAAAASGGGSDSGDAAAAAAGDLCSTDKSTAILASGTSFADAMIAGPLAWRGHHPVLLTGRDALAQSTLDWLTANSVEQVVVVGGSAVIGAPVRQALSDAGIGVVPISGANRYGTAAKLAEYLLGLSRAAAGGAGSAESCFFPSEIGLASGLGFADALAAAPLLGHKGAPLLLTGADLPPETLAYVKAGNLAPTGVGPAITVIGGSTAVPSTHRRALANAITP